MMSRKTEDKYNEKIQNQKIYSFTSKIIQRERQEKELKHINRSNSIKLHFAATLKSKSILPSKIDKSGNLNIRKMKGMKSQRKLPIKLDETMNLFTTKSKSLYFNRKNSVSSHKMMLAKRKRYNNVISSHLKNSESQRKKYKLIRSTAKLSILQTLKLHGDSNNKEYNSVYLTQRRF